MRFFLKRCTFGLFLAGILVKAGLASSAHAAQQLIPTPYPEQLGPDAQIGGGAPQTSGHQRLIPAPVPQSLGPNAQGNPPPSRAHRHQHLLKTPYWRQYHHWR